MIVAVMCHRDGGLKNIPTQARVVPLLNKVETPADLPVAQELATRLLACDRIEAVAIGAVQSTDRPITAVVSRTAAIILAAGGSSRFGSPKQLARWGQQTFLERAVDVALASQAKPVIVVLGAEIDQSQALLKDKPVELVINENWANGQSSSMKAGLAALPPNVSSVVFQLVDLPGISPDTIDALIQRYRATLAPVVWPEFEGRRGNPVLFDRSLFPELMQVKGDTGGKSLLVTYQDQAERISVGDQGILFDIDWAEDLEKYST